jgi:hypothetical protein
VIQMKKVFVIMVILTMMACSFWGAVACEANFWQPVNGLRNIVETSIPATIETGVTPDDGIPGGPPGTPG